MATIICMDGLGGHPETTFGELKRHVEAAGHKVILANVVGIETHQDRIEKVVRAFEEAKRNGAKEIYLLGFSAGGGAVRHAAADLNTVKENVKGVILVSQSLPNHDYLTPTLFWVMVRRIMDLSLFGKYIFLTEEEYDKLIAPVAPGQVSRLLANLQPIPGREARELAFSPREMSDYKVPSLVIYGDKDRWVATAGHDKLSRRMGEVSRSVTCYKVSGAGHLVLSSTERRGVFRKIISWIG